MTYNRLLEQIKSDNTIRMINKPTFITYKCQLWSYEKVVEFLRKKKNFWNNRTWVLKVKDTKMKEVVAEIKAWMCFDKIATKHWVSSRTVYRYKKMNDDRIKKSTFNEKEENR